MLINQCCFLNDRNRFNELGEALIKAHYKVDGHDYMGIDSFVNDVVINGNDYMKKERKVFQ